jgi:hypothetical protein
MRPSVIFPSLQVTLSGTAAKSANNNCDGLCKNDAGTNKDQFRVFR